MFKQGVVPTGFGRKKDRQGQKLRPVFKWEEEYRIV